MAHLGPIHGGFRERDWRNRSCEHPDSGNQGRRQGPLGPDEPELSAGAQYAEECGRQWPGSDGANEPELPAGTPSIIKKGKKVPRSASGLPAGRSRLFVPELSAKRSIERYNFYSA